MREPKKHRRSGGFTLLELVITLSIMGIAALIAVPRYCASLAKYRADATARRIAGDLQYLQWQARGAGTSKSVGFYSTGSYLMSSVTSLDTNAASYSVSIVREPYFAKFSGVNLANGTSTITFDAYGQPDNAASLSITVGAEQRTISVSYPSGRITWQ